MFPIKAFSRVLAALGPAAVAVGVAEEPAATVAVAAGVAGYRRRRRREGPRGPARRPM